MGCHGAYVHASVLCAFSFSFQHAKAVSLFALPLLNLLIVKRWYDDVVFEATRLAPTSLGPPPFVQRPPWTHLSLTCVAVAARSAPTLPDSPIAYMRGGWSWYVLPPLPQRTGLAPPYWHRFELVNLLPDSRTRYCVSPTAKTAGTVAFK